MLFKIQKKCILSESAPFEGLPVNTHGWGWNQLKSPQSWADREERLDDVFRTTAGCDCDNGALLETAGKIPHQLSKSQGSSLKRTPECISESPKRLSNVSDLPKFSQNIEIGMRGLAKTSWCPGLTNVEQRGRGPAFLSTGLVGLESPLRTKYREF